MAAGWWAAVAVAVSADQAFALLVRTSQHLNTRLRDLAERLVATDLPDHSPEPGVRRRPAGHAGRHCRVSGAGRRDRR